MGITRRDALKGLGAAVGAAAIGCGSDSAALAPDDTADASTATPPVDAGGGGEPEPRIDAGEPAPACSAPAELSATQLLAGIDTFVVLCMENRSFDHYLGSLRLVEGRTDIDGLTGNESNLDTRGNPVMVHRLANLTPEDPPHDWDEVHAQWNGGALDGFVRAAEDKRLRSPKDVMGYYTRDQLPVTYALADQAAICQRWFASALGPTWPNRSYLLAGTSNGRTGNSPVGNVPTIWDRLKAVGKTGTNFRHDFVGWMAGGFLERFANPWDPLHATMAEVETFFEQAKAGTLPNLSVIDPQMLEGPGNDDHPSHDVRFGQALIASMVRALGESPQWKRSALIITYDEHGGFYDHVAPPAAVDSHDDFQRLGFRVPTLVVGPTVRRGCPVNTTLEHSSLISTLTVRYGLQALTARSQQAATIAGCIDPALLDNPQPAPKLPTVQVPRGLLTAARALTASPTAHSELRDAAARLGVGPDRRRRGIDVMERVLRYGEELGAVRIEG